MKKFLVSAFAVLLATIVLVVLQLGPEYSVTSRNEPGTAESKDTVLSESTHAKKDDELSIARKTSGYESARLFSSGLQQLTVEFGEGSPAWNSYALRWAHSCRENLGRAEMLRSEEKLKAGTSRAIDLFRKFCEGVPPYGELEASGAYQKSTRIEFSKRLNDLERQGGVDAAIDFATAYLREAKDPCQMRAALDYLQRIGLFEAPGSSWIGSEQQAVAVYKMARESYICGRQSGCSAGHPLTLEFCIQHGCERLDGYQTLVMEQLSPAEQKLYRWYLSIFRSLSAGHAL